MPELEFQPLISCAAKPACATALATWLNSSDNTQACLIQNQIPTTAVTLLLSADRMPASQLY
jgi:hypothetical protein